jgi:hypothetical protein
VALSDDVVTLAGLAKFELPTRDMRLCDSGFVYFGGEKYTSADVDFGAIETVEPFEEATGDEASAGTLTFLPSSVADAADLSSPSYQGSRIRFWLGEVDRSSGEIVGTPELLADMVLDTTELRLGRGFRRLEMGLVDAGERLFLVNEGNTMSPRHHKAVWPGELGLDNATGKPVSVAWGVTAPPRGTVGRGGGASREPFGPSHEREV